VINGGLIVGDGPTVDVLSDDRLMRDNRLELPLGFFPRAVRSDIA
jgi:cobalt/nickel transport system ATP-binding protein